VSNADAMEIRGWGDSPAAGCFDATIFSCEVGYVKPEPQIYRICLERLGVSAGEAVFVGDGGSNELPGARAVGLATVMMAGVLREHWPERVEGRAREADFRIDRLAELLAES